jgi:MFS family permease
METTSVSGAYGSGQAAAKVENPDKAAAKAAAKRVMGNWNFRLLWAGQATSLLGDQFHMIALPWLVLLITGDAAALGLVLALMGVPRVVFMLVGGAVSDRFSQRTIMLISDILRLGLTSTLAIMVFTGNIQMWMLYVLALAFGVVSGFFMPAAQSIVPRIVGKDDLMIGNAIVQSSSLLSVLVGPLVAGGLIAWFAGSQVAIASSSPIMTGVGIAFAVDALTFVVSVITLWMMRIEAPQAPPENKGIFISITEGITYTAKSRRLVALLGLAAVINFLFAGPVVVGIPVIASTRLPEGAAAFGILMAASAIGSLVGMAVSGLAKVPPRHLGLVVAAAIGFFGLGLAAIGFIGSVWVGVAILLAIGTVNGYIGIVLITLLQKSTPPEMMGRLMSLVTISSVGLVPVSQALSGFAIKISIEGLFVGCGVLIVLLAVMAALSKNVRSFGIDPLGN